MKALVGLLASASVLLALGCGDDGADGQGANGGGESTAANPTGGVTTGATDDAAQYCVDKINTYRASIGLGPYTRWTEAEACSDGEAESDGSTGTPHGAFGTCGEFAQNECPDWSGDYVGVMDGCLQLMWDEGPGEPFEEHGHYINMSSTQYTSVACGFHTFPDGRVWAVQNFK